MIRHTHKIAISLAAIITIAAGISWSRYQQDEELAPTISYVPNVKVGDPQHFPAPTRKTAKRNEQEIGHDTFKLDIENLLKLANEGDVDAAEMAFHETAQCYDASTKLVSTTVHIKICAEETRPEFQEKCRQRASALSETLRVAKEQSEQCPTLDPYDEINLRYQAARIAAKFGDLDAQVCLVGGDYDQRVMHLSTEEEEQYQIDAIDYFNQAMERGDWRAVQAMTISRQSLGHGRSLRYLLTEGDERTRYRMRRLLRYGATGEYVEEVSEPIPGGDTGPYANEELWAKQQYEAHFLNSPPLDKRPTVCGQPW